VSAFGGYRQKRLPRFDSLLESASGGKTAISEIKKGAFA
jgi:hypothetical protein